MSDKTYKLILLGQIADGADPAEIKDKLAIIFEKSEKNINKLFKKKPTPVVIRKNLTQEMALRYKIGLEKIGVLCEIENRGGAVIQTGATSKSSPASPETFSLQPLEATLGMVRVINVQMSVGTLIAFLIKWLLASIPAFLLLGVVGTLFFKFIHQILSNFIS